jgi:hypothetical protein
MIGDPPVAAEKGAPERTAEADIGLPQSMQ